MIISLGADPKDVPGAFQIGGDRSILYGGNFSTLYGGDGYTLTGGQGSTLQGGVNAKLIGGRRSILTGGEGSTVHGGNFSNLTGGNGSTLHGGGNSCFVGSYWKDDRKRLITVYVGEDGIKADTWYRFEDDVFTEVVDKQHLTLFQTQHIFT
ncbi:MAG: Ice nucleation protein [Syntrophomonadaceae bacterium]|nr:Ice nucleation protein [Bacillota bacterium]